MSGTPQNARDIFIVAVEQYAPDRWPEYLDKVCAEDPDLRQRVERLLEAHRGDESILDNPVLVPQATIDQPITEKPGTQIGPYKLLQQIGEGGMGVVYMAEQKQPMKRRVALKIIKPGMDTRQVIARFEAERQALAMMDHPNIAKVLDAGQTESGRPYFVMELVNGISVTKYCDEQHLNPKERLNLFVHICQAVQHAHQKGIIHRDLKPSNVLVALYDGKAVPKVIDFGVAKATNQSLTDKTMFTQLGQIVGTLEYMSPEQAQRNQLDVDTRSDIYSLGVILYELLAGETPFDSKRLRSAVLEEMLRIIREDEPSKPSTKVSSSQSLPSIAANRRSDPQKLGATIRGELDWIVMKALEKDRSRRYETASKFAEDVEHYLNDEAVAACPPSAWYKFSKFARRNKAAIGTTATISAALIVGIIGTSWQAYAADKERDRAVIAEGVAEERLEVVESQKSKILAEKNRAIAAEELAEERLATVSQQKDEIAEEKKNTEEQAEITQAVSNFLRKDLLGMADAAQQVENEITPDPNIKLRTLLDRAATTIEERFHDRPLVKAAIRNTLGNAYFAIGQFQESEEQERRALELQKQELGPEHPCTLSSMNNLAVALFRQGQNEDAEKLFRETLALTQRVMGPEHPDALARMMNLANSLSRQDQHPDAEKLYRETFEIQQRVLGPEHPSTLVSMRNLASSLGEQGQYEAAENLCRESLALCQRVLGPEHPDTLISMYSLASSLNDQGQYEDAEKLCRETLALCQRVLGPEHPDTLRSMQFLGILLMRQGRYQQAETLLRETLDIQQRVLGPEHHETLRTKRGLADSLALQDKHKDAGSLLRETLDIQQRVLGLEHSDTLTTMNSLAVAYENQGNEDESEQLYRTVLAIQRRVLGPENPDTLLSVQNLANCLGDQRKNEEAVKLHSANLEIRRRVLGPEHPNTLLSMQDLGVSLYNLEKWEEAEKLHRESLEIRQRVLGPEHTDTLVSKSNLALCVDKLGDVQLAETLLRESLEEMRRVLGTEHFQTLLTMYNLATHLNDQGKFQEAEKLHRECLELRKRVLGAEHTHTLMSMSGLTLSLGKLAKWSDAEKLLRETLPVRQRELGAEHPKTLDSLQNLALCLRRQDKHQDAEKLIREALEASRRVLGADHPATLIRLEILGQLQYQLGQLANAADTYDEAVERHRRSSGEDHLNTLRCQGNLAVIYKRLNKFTEALSLHRQSFEGSQRTFGEDDPRTVFAQKQLVSFLASRTWLLATASDLTQRDPAEAVRLAKLACEVQSDNANNWNNLGVAQYRAGDFDAAVETLLKADGLIEGGDRQHRMFLAMTLHQLGRTDEAIQKYVEGAAWIAAHNKKGEQLRFRGEAEKLLGLNAKRRDELIAEYRSNLPPKETRAPANQLDQSTPKPIGK